MATVHPDPHDGLPHAETAYFLPHENLGPNRDDCPDECFVWKAPVPDPEPEDDEAGDRGQAKKKHKRNPRPHKPDPGFWFEDNKILLDPHNNPIKAHLNIPLTLSAHTEGCKMDLMRILNASISQRDLWARMVRLPYPKIFFVQADLEHRDIVSVLPCFPQKEQC